MPETELARLERRLGEYRELYRQQPSEANARECEALYLLICQLKAERENEERSAVR